MASPYLVATSATDSSVTVTNNPGANPSSFKLTTPYDGDTISLSLASTVGVSTWIVSIIGTDGSVLPSAFTVTQATLISGAASIVCPSASDDYSFLVQSQINGGQNADGSWNDSFTSTLKVCVKAGSKNTISWGECGEEDVRNGYNKLLSSKDFGPVRNNFVDGGLVLAASFVAYSGDPTAANTAITLTDLVSQAKAFSYTTRAAGTYQYASPSLLSSRNTPRNVSSTNVIEWRPGNNLALSPRTADFTVSAPCAFYCRFRCTPTITGTRTIWYKSGNSEAAPASSGGIGLQVSANGFSLLCANTSYPLGVPFDGEEHSMLVSLTGTTLSVFFDKRPSLSFTVSVNALNKGLWLGDISAATDTQFGLQVFDVRVYSEAKTRAHAMALASGVF